jgi:N-acetylglutamate synthase and related acetyltransferases
MTDHDLTLEPVTDADRQYVESLLSRNSLPDDDFGENRDALSLCVCYRGDERVGVGGIETYGTDALLRSVVVTAEARGEGIGQALCEGLEAHASGNGTERLYLLTTTARTFFLDLGYGEIDRDDVPPSIRETRQFSELCPSSAACLSKSL